MRAQGGKVKKKVEDEAKKRFAMRRSVELFGEFGNALGSLLGELG